MANEPAPPSISPAAIPENYRRLAEWIAESAGVELIFEPTWIFEDSAVPVRESSRELPLRAMLACGEKVGRIEQATLSEQPNSVQPIAGKLFSAYQVDDGHIQLAGCQLDDHWVCRATYREGRNAYYNSMGDQLPDALVASIGLQNLSKRTGAAEISAGQSADAIAIALERASDGGESPVSIAIAPCRHVSGKIRFTIGNMSWDLPFSGWANGFAPPPFICPHSGMASFHVSSTDDGRIVAAEALATCHRSGRRLLRNEFVQCAVTGVCLLPEYAVHCPVTEEVVEQSCVVECRRCRQWVSPHALREEICAACWNLRPIAAADPGWLKLTAEYPGLSAWRRWRMSETSQVYILAGQGVWQRLLAVIDRRTLHCRYMATANRWPAVWKELSAEQARELLGGKAI